MSFFGSSSLNKITHYAIFFNIPVRQALPAPDPAASSAKQKGLPPESGSPGINLCFVNRSLFPDCFLIRVILLQVSIHCAVFRAGNFKLFV